MNTTKKYAGRGRTKNSFSFTKVTIEDLTNKFADKKTHVIISRKWAEAVGFTGLVSQNVGALTESIAGEAPETAAKVLVTEL
jgi:hypothetical protein